MIFFVQLKFLGNSIIILVAKRDLRHPSESTQRILNTPRAMEQSEGTQRLQRLSERMEPKILSHIHPTFVFRIWYSPKIIISIMNHRSTKSASLSLS